MLKITKILVCLISLSSLSFSGEVITFKELTNLASKDIGRTIFLDKNIKDYSVEINIIDHHEKGEIYEFFKVVLFEHDLELQYNKNGDFYFIKHSAEDEALKLNYYTYKIKNITNEDVIKSMSIFKGVSFQYLAQSDMIAYSAIDSVHEQIREVLRASDNAVLTKTIKITIFSINKKKFSEIGSTIKAFQYDFDTTLDGIFQAFRSGGSSQFSLNDTVGIGFTLHALAGHSAADIFQQPTIRLTNGVKTSVSSVVNVPYLQTTSTVDSTTNSVVAQYNYKDVGLQINIMPKIKDDWVYIDLNLISDELISLDDDKPITQKIAYQNTVKVSKGKPILLTGIKKTSKQITKDGIPYLSDIPLLGELFKKKVMSNDEQNMNILIEVL